MNGFYHIYRYMAVSNLFKNIFTTTKVEIADVSFWSNYHDVVGVETYQDSLLALRTLFLQTEEHYDLFHRLSTGALHIIR